MYDIEIISAPSNLGLRPTGVELLAASLLDAGLAAQAGVQRAVKHVPTLNHLYSANRDEATKCLNPQAIHDFSVTLAQAVKETLDDRRLAVVLGGDCSILLGIMPALKQTGKYGLIFIDAHADFYQPGQSATGEVADMDLAIVTGRGPVLLTNINNQLPYIKDAHVVHLGQRDWEETRQFGSQDIRETGIRCFDAAYINEGGIEQTTSEVINHINGLSVDGYWIHFDTDVLCDEENPAVEYHLPGGLQLAQVAYCLGRLLETGKIAGISVTIYNPKLDKEGKVARAISDSLSHLLKPHALKTASLL